MTRVIDGPVLTGFPGAQYTHPLAGHAVPVSSFDHISRRLRRSPPHLTLPPPPPSPFLVSAIISFLGLSCHLPPPGGSSLARRLPSIYLSIYLSIYRSGSMNDPHFFPRSEAGRVRLHDDPSILKTGSSSW
jgi:hypothetical protein